MYAHVCRVAHALAYYMHTTSVRLTVRKWQIALWNKIYWKLSNLEGECISHKTNNFVATFRRIINIFIFTLTPGRPTGEILMEQTYGKSDQSNPRCVCAPRVNNRIGCAGPRMTKTKYNRYRKWISDKANNYNNSSPLSFTNTKTYPIPKLNDFKIHRNINDRISPEGSLLDRNA